MNLPQDYLKYYIGCPILICEPGVEEVFHYQLEGYDKLANLAIAERTSYPIHWIKLLLRSKQSMTFEEAIELTRLTVDDEDFINPRACRNQFQDIIVYWNIPDEMKIPHDPFIINQYEDFGILDHSFNATGEYFYSIQQFDFLLSHRFDIWGLIEQGLAQEVQK